MDSWNITDDWFDFLNTHFITQEKDSLLRKLKRKDIVLTTRGSVWNIALYDDNIPFEKVRNNSWVVIIRCKMQVIATKKHRRFKRRKYVRLCFRTLIYQWKKITNIRINPWLETLFHKNSNDSGGEGIEPPTAVPKTDVLPLHQPPVVY